MPGLDMLKLEDDSIAVNMVSTPLKKLTKAEFWAIADTADRTYELIDGIAVAKMSPKYFHSRSTGKIYLLLIDWAENRGRVGIEWSIDLTDDFTPVPDLLYISFDRLPLTWDENFACPIAPELAIEIISPGQTFGQMIQKASHYLASGVLRVWVVDPAAKSLTAFYPDTAPITYTEEQLITDHLFPDLSIIVNQLF
jgi:Uma2 family endonuclease